MKCVKCGKKAVFKDPTLCKDHFMTYFEKKVYDTIDEYNLIDKDNKVVVAVSGGKDSLTTLYLLSKKYAVSGLCINEGIAGYRDKTIIDTKAFCKKYNIPLKIVSFEEEYGGTLDQELHVLKKMGKPLLPCSICGVKRRALMDKHSKEFNIIATGHNADDESQAVMMNLLRSNLELMPRLGPRSGQEPRDFTKKVKPLYFCTEKEVMTYSILKGIQTTFTECPNIDNSFRPKIRNALNKLDPQVKINILKKSLEVKSKILEKRNIN